MSISNKSTLIITTSRKRKRRIFNPKERPECLNVDILEFAQNSVVDIKLDESTGMETTSDEMEFELVETPRLADHPVMGAEKSIKIGNRWPPQLSLHFQIS